MQEIAKVLEQTELIDSVYSLWLDAPATALKVKKPGQFVNLLVNRADLLLRRPISICEVSGEKIRLVYRTEGQGTKEFSKLKPGDKVDFFGPLGNGFEISVDSNKKVVLIGGGIGAPPLLGLGKELKKLNIEVKIVLGFAAKEQIILANEFEEIGQVYIATNDGSFGFKGNVLELIKEKGLEFDSVFACGPTPMLKAINSEFAESSIKENVFLSTESRMACGIGACYGCVMKVPESETKAKRVCFEGPVFKAGEVEFE